MQTSKVVGLAILAGAGVLFLRRRQQGLGAPLNLVRASDGSYYYPSGSDAAAASQASQAQQLADYRAAAISYADRVGNREYVDATTPSAGSFALKTGVGTGTAITGAALAPGALAGAAVAIPIIGAGVAALAYAIGVKGWLRGGEEALQVSPRRDLFLGQFGPSGDESRGLPWEETGAAKLAAALTELTGEPDGSHYWKNLMAAQDMETFVPATREIKALLAAFGIEIEAF